MTGAERIAEYERLLDVVIEAVKNGELSSHENDLRALRLIHAVLPNQRKNDAEHEMRGIEETIANIRREDAISRGAGGVRYLPIHYQEPGCCEDGYYR